MRQIIEVLRLKYEVSNGMDSSSPHRHLRGKMVSD